MAYPYPKKTWVSKEIIKRSALQNIEDGIYDEQQARLREQQEYSQIILDEVNRATGAESALSSSIGAETTRATAAEEALANSISGIGSSITSLTTQLTNEINNRTNADTTITNRIALEEARAQQAESDLRDYVDDKVGSAYKASGSIYFANLPALDSTRVGNVYDIKDAFTTTASFLEGAGKNYPAGTNVVIVNIGTSQSPNLKYDAVSGLIDLSNYVQKTDYASSSAFGVVKVDGTTVTSNNGVLSSKGGHTIKNASTSFTQRDNLKFENCTVTDDSTNNQTIVSPTVPTVGNGTLTIQKNGTNVQTFAANASSDVTANITVPTKTSEITNDSNFSVCTYKNATLAQNNTDVTFTGLPTTGNHLYDIYTDKPGLDYIAMEVPQAGQLKVTFEPQTSATNVYLKITDI